MNLSQNVPLMKSRLSLKMGHVGSGGQILEKPCVRSAGLIIGPILMKLGQNVCLNEISDEFETGSCDFKNKITRSNF